VGVNAYWFIVAIIIILGIIMPQEGEKRKKYIFIMVALHTFFCGCRYMYITGDLRKYAYNYLYVYPKSDWIQSIVINNGRNAGFTLISRLISIISGGNYQFFLFFLAILTQAIVGVIIFKYSVKPWLSYLVWNCFCFYTTYEYAAIKQGLAMAIIMLAMMAVLEKNIKMFVVCVIIASFIHFPAIIFLPAYFIANSKKSRNVIIGYALTATILFIFRDTVVEIAKDVYYDNDVIDTTIHVSLGGRFFVILSILLSGLILKGFKEKKFGQLYGIITIGAIIQMFSGYNNVFTRFADYYLQFLILFIPMIFHNTNKKSEIIENRDDAIIKFDERSNKLFVVCLTIVFIWYYYKTFLGTTSVNEVDDLVNYRFMWQVK